MSRLCVRSVLALAAVGGLTTAGLTSLGNATSAVFAAQPESYPLSVVVIDEDVSLFGLQTTSFNGERISLSQTTGDAVVVDTVSLATIATPSPQHTNMSSNGRFTYDVTNDYQVERFDTVTSASTTFDPHDSTGWFEATGGGLRNIVASDDGDIVGLQASNGAIGRVAGFVYDVSAGRLLTPTNSGISEIETNSQILEVSPDGTEITYYEYCCAGGQPSRFVRWNRTDDTRITVDRPDAHDAFAAPWTTSPDLSHVAFVELGTLKVQNLAGGAVRSLPRPVNDIDAYALTNDGIVVFLADAPTGDSGAAPQLFAWGGQAAPVQVSLEDGEPSTNSVETFVVSSDGSTITFTTFDSASSRILLQATLRAPARAAQRIADTRPGIELGGTTIQPGETRCVPTIDTTPGEFVVLNVTPLNASARGFGTIHSSNESAGNTSNVNYSIGTIDPNIAITKVGDDGNICYTNAQDGNPTVNVIIDQLLNAPASTFTTPTAAGATRIADTRPGIELGGTTIQPGETRCLDIDGAAAGSFVVANLLVTNASARGFATLHSSDIEAGSTANVNYDVGTVDPNVAISEVGTDEAICITNSAAGGPTANLIADHLLSAPAGTFSTPVVSEP